MKNEMLSLNTSDSLAAWGDALSATRERSPASFDQWFAGVQFEGFTDGVLSLRARDEFVRDWIDSHFLPHLAEALRTKTGFSVRVAWSIGGPLESPISSGAMPWYSAMPKSR